MPVIENLAGIMKIGMGIREMGFLYTHKIQATGMGIFGKDGGLCDLFPVVPLCVLVSKPLMFMVSAENCVGPRLLPCPKLIGRPLSFLGVTLGVKYRFFERIDAPSVTCGWRATEVPWGPFCWCAPDVLRIMMLHF